ncbi:MAG: MptD family putative ECF transporter S component [Bifidobacteriaceae bacterium]|jgi:energy-coupling factor transport system substrate-specific component|nr:MptD family putative ECF transporter S component [Bifidobacteriaceae bacterium]
MTEADQADQAERAERADQADQTEQAERADGGDQTASSAEATGSPPRFSARDLVNVAVFGVIFLVVAWSISMLGVISPVVWLVTLPLEIVACGIPFALFLTRVKRGGLVAVFGLIVALFFLLAGNTLISSLGIVALGAAADLIFRAGGGGKWASILAYTVFSLGFFTPFLPVLFDREAYFASSTWTDMGAAYTAAANALLTGPVLGLMAGAVLVAGFAGGLIGAAILRKHFVRAGLA